MRHPRDPHRHLGGRARQIRRRTFDGHGVADQLDRDAWCEAAQHRHVVCPTLMIPCVYRKVSCSTGRASSRCVSRLPGPNGA